jgi:hypothetical protein
LYVLIQGGRGLIKKFYGLADNNGLFKKVLGVILIITGLLICTGYMKKLEATLIDYVPDSGKIESLLIKNIHTDTITQPIIETQQVPVVPQVKEEVLPQ